MKKLYTILAVVLLTASTLAQAPEKMSYQAVVRDSSDNLVSNQIVGMQISILKAGIPVYVETQTPTTNVNGLVTLEIGGSSATVVYGTFAGINWATGPYFIKTETDPAGGTTYTITGTSQLLSVPYALYDSAVAQPIYTVNTFYAELGGYVLEINADGTHGLVVAMQDQGISNWYEANDLLSKAANHGLDGAKFKDWRIPTKRELNFMYSNRVAIGNFDLSNSAPTYSFYWSSTEYAVYHAWGQDFASNNQPNGNEKPNTYNVRAVRDF
jgi:hypothetical protein